jgi:predicted nucleotidyltransferase
MNIKDKKIKLAIDTVLEYYKNDNIVGLLLQGSFAKGTATKFSDVDLAFLCRDKKQTERLMKEAHHLYDFGDFFIEPRFYNIQELEKAPLSERYFFQDKYTWSQSERFSKQYAKILYDPENRIKKLLKKKLVIPKREKDLLIDDLTYLINLGLAYKLPRIMKNERYLEAHFLMNSIAKNIVEYLHISNNRFIPYEGDLFYLLTSGKLKGVNDVKKIFVANAVNKSSCLKRIRIIRSFCKKYKIQVSQGTVQDYTKKFGAKKWSKK